MTNEPSGGVYRAGLLRTPSWNEGNIPVGSAASFAGGVTKKAVARNWRIRRIANAGNYLIVNSEPSKNNRGVSRVGTSS
jgi:hypothetical protein